MLTKEERMRNLKTIVQAAIQAEKITGCPAEVSVAQCILESSWLEVAPNNNCFGIKNTDRFPGVQYQVTREYLDGSWKSKILAFEVYPTLKDCFVDHGFLITGGFKTSDKNCYYPAFEELARTGNIIKYVDNISHFYATDPHYAESVKEIMSLKVVIDAIHDARFADYDVQDNTTTNVET